MIRSVPFILILALYLTGCGEAPHSATSADATGKTAIAIHGGAGNLKKLKLTAEEEKAYRDALDSAITLGQEILEKSGSAVDAVERTLRYLEDCPLFNAGKGSVFTHEGTNEMDAAIMDGSNLACGAVAGVRRIKNPITTARRVMDKSEFVLLSGAGAEEFAISQGIELVDTSYFFTSHRWNQLRDAIQKDEVNLDHGNQPSSMHRDSASEEYKFGTVGCVALDKSGNIAAGTSTGGLTNKRYNRIGDSPLIGCGTYANNASCAVSCTGKGEDFIRHVAAHSIASLVKEGHLTIQEAADSVIQKNIKSTDGRGGCIALNKQGEIAISFTTNGMFRATINTDGIKAIQIYKEDH